MMNLEKIKFTRQGFVENAIDGKNIKMKITKCQKFQFQRKKIQKFQKNKNFIKIS